jgi:uncharacterized protein (TIGR02452 family)
MRRKSIAQDTMSILERGDYIAPGGARVSLAGRVRECLAGTRCYLPEQLSELQEEVLSQSAPFAGTSFGVTNETTLQAARRIAGSGDYSRIGVLNFASARNPGGGFLGGAHAQEESLARSSGLYPSLLKCEQHYQYHRKQSSLLYSDRMIYSPVCPIFRTDDGTLLDQPCLVDFVTSPAPNAGAIRRNEPESVAKIASTLQERSGKVLAILANHQCDAIILGAWGCGVFQNDPAMVAEVFKFHLAKGHQFNGRFRTVLFAVLDNSPTQSTITPFNERFMQV